LRRTLTRFTAAQIYELVELVKGIANFDFDFALECLELSTPVIKQRFAANSLNAYFETRDLRYWVLGQGLFGEGRPSKTQRRITKEIFDAIDPKEIVDGILTCPFGDWENYAGLLSWVHRVDRKKHRAIVDAMDWTRLDAVMADKWQRPSREMRLLLSCFASDQQGEPIRSWIAARSNKMEEIDPILAGRSPEAAIDVFHRGRDVKLDGHNRIDWRLQAWAIARIAEIDEPVAIGIVTANRQHIARGLSAMDGAEEFPALLNVIDKLQSLLVQVFKEIDLELAAEKWPIALKGHEKEGRSGARKTLEIIGSIDGGSAKKLADDLLNSVRSPLRSSK